MKRFALQELLDWKNQAEHKPLIVQGARQVGKTWLMREFGREYYENFAYFNFDGNANLRAIFDSDFEISRILLALEILAGTKILPKKTLIIFDEIQECPRALTALKYFNENAPDYDVVAAGSLLGIACHAGTGFPVGKVTFMSLFPLNFEEFLLALGEENLVKILRERDFSMLKIFAEKLDFLLKQYCFVGGMPAIVANFAKNKDFKKVRALQKEILSAYENDFTKHVPANTVAKIRLLWQSVPAQLCKENKKFIYGAVKGGARAREFETALSWLINCGLIFRVNRITKPDLPLVAYEDFSAFKLFLLDVGLLGAMTNLSAKTILEKTQIFEEFKGAIAEQFVFQQLKTLKDLPIFYWSNETSRAELDFVVQIDEKVVPVEVKATRNLQAKSLKNYIEKFVPARAVRTSLADFKITGTLVDLPLFAILQIKKI